MAAGVIEIQMCHHNMAHILLLESQIHLVEATQRIEHLTIVNVRQGFAIRIHVICLGTRTIGNNCTGTAICTMSDPDTASNADSAGQI